MKNKIKCFTIQDFLTNYREIFREFPELKRVKKVIIKGPPGIGKSTTIRNFNIRYNSKGNKYTAIDCEQIIKSLRANIVHDSQYGLFGSADLAPSNYIYSDVLWIYLTMDPLLLAARRKQRDEDDFVKKDQRFYDSLKVVNGFAEIEGSIRCMVYIDMALDTNIVCKYLFDVLNILYLSNDVRQVVIPSEMSEYIKNKSYTDRRKVYTDTGFSYFDSTPFNILASLTFTIPDLPFNIDDIIQPIIQEKGELVPFVEYYKTVSTIYKQKYSQNFPYSTILNKFHLKTVKSQQFAVALVLPPSGIWFNGRCNMNNFEILTMNSPKWDIFFPAFIKTLISECKRMNLWNEVVQTQIGKLFTKFNITTESTQNINKSSKHVFETTEYERKCVAYWAKKDYQLSKLLLDNLDLFVSKKPEDMCPDMKPFNSPGARLVDENGYVYNADEHLECLDEAFTSSDPKHNGFYKRSFRELKKFLVKTIPAHVKYRLSMAKKWKIFDARSECEAFNSMNARTQIRALRRNGPDDVNKENEEGVNDIVLRHIRSIPQTDVTLDDIYDAIRYCNGVLLQGKDRVSSLFTREGYKTYKVPKVLYSVTLEKRRLEWLEQNAAYIKDPKLSTLWYQIASHSLLGSVLRIRGIFPSDWVYNMYDLIMAKPYTLCVEKCLIGVPVLNVQDKNYQFINGNVSKALYVITSHDDTTNNETSITSNPTFIIGGAPFDSADWILEIDSHSGWITSEDGPLFHGPQTSSGIGYTTRDNVKKAIVTSSLDISYRAKPEDRYNLFCYTIDFIYDHIYLFLSNYLPELNTKALISQNFVPDAFPSYKLKNGTCYCVHCNGTDDNIYFDCSNTVSQEDMFENLHNKDIEDFRRRWLINHDDGPGSHFGVDTSSSGYTKTEVTSLGKFFSHEHVTVGDFIAMKYVAAFEKFPPLKKAVQAGLDAIEGGSVEIYELASNWISRLLHERNCDLTEYLSSFDLSYNPNAQALKEKLGDLVNKNLSNKIPVEIVMECVKLTQEFRMNYKYDKALDPYAFIRDLVRDNLLE